MKIMGIDASHRNTGVVILSVLPASKRILSIDMAETFTTKKTIGVLPEYAQVKDVIDRIIHEKFIHGVYTSVVEVAHFGQNFGSARNVGITWGIGIATKSEPYTENQVRSMFPKDKTKTGKEKALEWLLNHNLHLTEQLLAMDDHQIDATAVAMYHHLKNT
jgi:Holliday junction resolvasome RuvABC endonuclease subunit